MEYGGKMRMERNEGQNRYGWAIVIGGLLLLMVFMGIVNNCYALFIIPITESFHFTRSQYSVCQSLVFLFIMLSSAISWKIYQRVGILTAIRTAAVVLVVSYFCYSFAQSLPVFYLLSMIVGFCMGLTTTVAVPLLLSGWFQEKYGLALGISLMGSGIGGTIFNPAANMLIDLFNWQRAYQILALIMAAVALPIVFFVFRVNKSNAENMASNYDPSEEQPSEKSFLNRTAVSLLAIITIFAIVCTVLIYTITPYLQDIGYSAGVASFCASGSMAILAVGKLLEGWLLDHTSLKTCTYLAFASTAAGLIGLVLSKNPFMLLLVFLGVFLGCPYGTVAIPVAAGSICQRQADKRAAVGIFTAATNLGSAVSPALAGMVFDSFGSYSPLFITSAVIVIAAMIPIKKIMK